MQSALPNLPDLSCLSVRPIGGAVFSPPANPADEKPDAAMQSKALSKELPGDDVQSEAYNDALYGNEDLLDIAAAIESNYVISSVREAPFYETVRSDVAAGSLQWWLNWQREADQKVIGEGSFNRASLVRGPAMPPDAMFIEAYNCPVPFYGLIIRKSTDPKGTDKNEVVEEIVTGAYAQANGFGPTIYAAFYTLTSKEELRAWPIGSWDTRVTPQPMKSGPFRAKLNDQKVAVTITIAEAWEGDCTGVVGGRELQIEPGLFAEKLVALCARAADAGFWHNDIKRANMLYRTRPSFELCFTDFDPYFCKIRAPELRAPSRKCCIVATIAMILGELRCSRGLDQWKAYAPACVKALETEGIVLAEIEPTDWCFFLRDANETRIVKRNNKRIVLSARSLTAEELTLGMRFRGHIENYLQVDPGIEEDPERIARCFKFNSTQPLFHQIVKYTLA